MSQYDPATPDGLVLAGMEDAMPSPDFSAPFMELFTSIGGWIMAAGLVGMAIFIVIGAIGWLAGKFGTGGKMQEVSLSMCAWAIIAAMIIAVSGSIVMWATDTAPTWMDFT